MKIVLLRLPINYKENTIIRMGGCISSKFYYQWLTRYPPLGLLYTGSILKQNGHTVKLIDAEFLDYTLDKVMKTISDFKPDVVCSSVNIYAPKFEFECLKTIRKHLKFILICRGHFPRLYPEETILNEHVDFALYGKGFTIDALIKAIEQNGNFNEIPGIVYKEKGGIIKTQQEILHNLDHYPLPARDLIDNSIYTTVFTLKDNFTTMMASSGCPYSCTYCAEKNTPYQPRNIDRVIEEMEECKYKFKINEIFFFDSIFSLHRQRTIEFCNKLIQKKLDINWSFRTRTDCVDEELLDAAARAGCVKIHYGIESGDQKTLDRLKRQSDLNQIKKTIAFTAKKGISTFGYFMIGNDGETQNTAMKTIKMAKDLPLNFVQFIKVGPLPDTDVLKATKENLKIDLWLEIYKKGYVTQEQLKPQNTSLTLNQIHSLINNGYRSFYLRPVYLWRMLCFKYTPLYIVRQFKILLILIRLKLSSLSS